MAKTPNPIPGVTSARAIYGSRTFRFPIDVVNHENKMGIEPSARMTCEHCKTFKDPQHIADHVANRGNQGKLF